MSQEIDLLLDAIERKLDWGPAQGWQSRDFENLNQLILDETGVSLSASTLRRIWGRVKYEHVPSTTTLDTLAKFAGYGSWRGYQKQQTPKNEEVPVKEKAVTPPAIRRQRARLIIISLIILAIGLGTIYSAKKSSRQVRADDYDFSIETLTSSIPNSVIFTYDASRAPGDSIFIQQSWDQRTRVAVDKLEHKHTAVYYEPGFYQAKLLVGAEVVREQPLIIPTSGWLGVIENRPVPVYLDSSEFRGADQLSVALSVIEKKNIPLQPQAPMVKYFNVGSFAPVSLDHLSFSAKIKNEFHEGSAACQFSYIVLITDAAPIVIPASVKGCISDLYLRAVDHEIMGKKADLSGFAVDFSDWAKLGCQSDSGHIRFFVNDRAVFELPLPDHPVRLVGMGIYFQGTGAVKEVTIKDNGRLVFDGLKPVTRP